ncbi:hypothetical protein BDN67DRAFT_591000 [Paxillus ammoniavirescens]|nr:hypothetical protein BDN67DRAFT_591000 [Paxillus ammoniavirescens]
MKDRVTSSKDEAQECLKNILSRRSNSNCGRVLALLRPLADHGVLRESFLAKDVIKCFMQLLDRVLGDPRTDFDHVMDALGCLLKYEDLSISLLENRRSSLMLAGKDRSRLTASLHVILPFTRTQRGRTECKDLRPRLHQLARRYQGHVGLLAMGALLELYEVEKGEEQQAQLELAQCLLNNNFRANLAHAFNLNVTDDRTLSRDHDGGARRHALRQLFGLEGGDLTGVKILMDQLKLATAESNACERTAATLALLQLCENRRLRDHLSGAKITDAFFNQLKRRDSSLLGAYALAVCLRHVYTSRTEKSQIYR